MKPFITFLKEKGAYALLFFCIFMGTYFTMHSQQDPFDVCLTKDSDIPSPPVVYSNSSSQAVLDATDPVVFNVYYWRVNGPSGTVHPDALTEYKALESIQELNIVFNLIGIYFKYRGIEDIASPNDVIQENYDNGNCPTNGIDPDGFETLDRCQLGEFNSFLSTNNYSNSDGINIYVTKETSNFSGVAYGAKKTITSAINIAGEVIIHELGHNLGLPHTFVGWHSDDPTYEDCEHVTRDPNNLDYNADTRGDDVTDTAAMPDFLNEYCDLNGLPNSECTYQTQYGYYYFDKVNCEYTGTFRTDCQNTIYQIDSDNAQNYMAYAFGSCKNQFTIGQGIKMKETISGSTSLQSLTTDIASLYEPYAGEYYNVGPDQDPHDRPRFQPGFNYEFVECDCDCPQPSAYNDVSFNYNSTAVVLEIKKDETDFNSIVHPNHTAIYIDFVFDRPDYFGQATRRCYDNWNRNPKGGTVTKFNDGIFNTNVTLTPKDSTSINSPTLVNELPNGLYKIEKEYSDGATDETIISKGQE